MKKILPTPPEMAYILTGVAILATIAAINKVAPESKGSILEIILSVQSLIALLAVIAPLYGSFGPSVNLKGKSYHLYTAPVIYALSMMAIFLSIHYILPPQSQEKIDLLIWSIICNSLILLVIGARNGMKPPKVDF